MEAEFSKCEPSCAKDEDTSSTEGLIDEQEDDGPKEKLQKYPEHLCKKEVEPGPLENELDLLDAAFIREGTTLLMRATLILRQRQRGPSKISHFEQRWGPTSREEEKENVRDTDGSDDGLYDFSDVPEVAQFPKIPKNYLWITQQARTQYECIYGKRYTVRRVKPVDPSLLPPLMSLKVSLPEGIVPKAKVFDSENEDDEFTNLVQVLQDSSQHRYHHSSRSTSSSDQDYKQLKWYYTNGDYQRDRRRLETRRHRSRDRRRRDRSRVRRVPDREPIPSRRYRHRYREEERVHRSPTAIERYRYWTGREYRSRNRLAVRSPIRRRKRSSS